MSDWEILKYDNNFEINKHYPHEVRQIASGRIVKEYIDVDYYKLRIGSKTEYKHRILAIQFVQNNDPTNKNLVDHVNRNKLDNRIDNLRWVNYSENARNRSSNN